MKTYKVQIEGISPLLMNKPEEYGFDEGWVQKKASNEYEKEAYKKLYLDEDDKLCQPSAHIEQSLIEAGKKIRVKGQGKATYSKLFGSMVSIPDMYLEHEIQDWEIFKQLVVIPSTKGRVMRYRPMLKKWKLSFNVDIEEEIDIMAVREALDIAGRYVGIGDWRPQKKGKFGKFHITSFQEVN